MSQRAAPTGAKAALNADQKHNGAQGPQLPKSTGTLGKGSRSSEGSGTAVRISF